MRRTLAALVCLLTTACVAQRLPEPQRLPQPQSQPRPVSDTLVATDGLGRTLPTAAECGPPRAGKQVGIFYFLWLGEHAGDGPWDVTKILARDPQAMAKPDSPLWGPMFAPHHWGEPVFGYYRADDPYVLRRHAQMLSDAGVDFVVFDVTNQFTYKPWYTALLKTWSQVRAEGGKAPQVAFLTPFWQPAKVVDELWRDLYGPGLYSDMWYRLDGKPLILADPNLIASSNQNTNQDHPEALEGGHTLGQSFHSDQAFSQVGGSLPTWTERTSAATLTLRRGGPTGQVVATERREALEDNGWWMLQPAATQPAGDYYLELSAPGGKVGWWSHGQDVWPSGQAYADGQPVAGDRTIRVVQATAGQDDVRTFFTFRKPQADYFQGPTGPDQWSWLEVYPQHVFRNSRGEKEMISVGVAQNAVDRRLGSMSERNSKGRAWHNGANDPAPGASDRGLNFAEQWTKARAEDPNIVFITGWNEWIAGRFPEFSGIKEPVMFVDEFDREHSRDIEPMVGGHGDAFYYQMVAEIRRFKGVPTPQAPSAPRSMALATDPAAWAEVLPDYRDDANDPARRDHLGYGKQPAYVNTTGTHDILQAKVARDAQAVTFWLRTAAPLGTADGLTLFVDLDSRADTGWAGYDLAVRCQQAKPGVAKLERWTAGSWQSVSDVPCRVDGAQLALSIPRQQFGQPLRFGFKWFASSEPPRAVEAFTTDGDAAPNCRFNWRYAE